MRNDRPILLVEDDKVDVITIKRAMKDLGMDNPLRIAGNGLEALKVLEDQQEDPPYIILLDLNMPGMNGIEFLKELEKRKCLKRYPIVVLSTSREERDIEESFKLGVAGYMVKPIDYDKFVTTFKNINKYWSTSLIPD